MIHSLSENGTNVIVCQGVEHDLPFLAALDQFIGTKYTELVRYRRLGHTEKLRQIVFNDGKMFTRKPELQARPRGNIGYNRGVLNDPFTFPVYNGEIPYILDEFGGIKCAEANPSKENAWGYGNAAVTKEDFYKRLESQVKAITSHSDKICGFCYTQITDVEQEQNGVYYFNRESKYDMERVRKIFQMKAEGYEQ